MHFSIFLWIALLGQAFAQTWEETVVSVEAYTEIITPRTITIFPTTKTFYSSISGSDLLTIIQTDFPATSTLPGLTETVSGSQATQTLVPTGIQVLGSDVATILSEFAPVVTSISNETANKIRDHYGSYFSSFSKAHPYPTRGEVLGAVYIGRGVNGTPVPVSIQDAARVGWNPFQPSSVIESAFSVISSYPGLAEDVRAYNEAWKTRDPESYIHVLDQVWSDLGLTNGTAPTWMCYVSSLAPTEVLKTKAPVPSFDCDAVLRAAPSSASSTATPNLAVSGRPSTSLVLYVVFAIGLKLLCL